MHTAADGITAALLALLVALLGVIGWRAWRRSRITPEEKERRRRLMLVSAGKISDANLVDINEELLMYSYSVRGVLYTASQDITRLKAFLPGDLSGLGHVCVKYDPHNPANSIVLAEEWTGLQPVSPPAPPIAPPLSPGS